MKIINQITENEMIGTFLQAEINSKRFQKYINDYLTKKNLNKNLIERPNFKSAKENNLRYEILDEYRGYGKRTELFENFPQNLNWYEVELNKKEVQKVKYINYDFWIELSNKTRRPKEAAKNIQNGKKVFNQPNNNFIEAAEKLEKGTIFPEMILVAKSENDYLVALEGNLRLTAYALKPNYVPEKTKAILGISKGISNWGLY